jgi:hypothetical protein
MSKPHKTTISLQSTQQIWFTKVIHLPRNYLSALIILHINQEPRTKNQEPRKIIKKYLSKELVSLDYLEHN